MTIHEFRKAVRQQLPHVTVTIKTMSFQDLARADARCLTVRGDQSAAELRQINEWARQAGVVPDGSLRFYPARAAATPESDGGK